MAQAFPVSAEKDESKHEVIRAETSAAKSSRCEGRLETPNFPASGQQGCGLPSAKAGVQPAPPVSSPTQAGNQRPSLHPRPPAPFPGRPPVVPADIASHSPEQVASGLAFQPGHGHPGVTQTSLHSGEPPKELVHPKGPEEGRDQTVGIGKQQADWERKSPKIPCRGGEGK